MLESFVAEIYLFMDHQNIYFDTILVPLSFFFLVGYHVYLWYCLKHKPLLTTIGINKMRRRKWAQTIIKNCNEILAVQSGRNALMGSILTAAITMLFLSSSLAAITNNTYNASNFLKDSYFGSHSTQMLALKYGSVSIFLLMGFLSSSMAVGCLNEINFLINVVDFEPGYVLDMLERGDSFAFVGNRVLFISFPLLLWMFGPVAMILSSMALVWILYELDFTVSGSGKESSVQSIV